VGIADIDTIVSKESYNVSLLAAGGVISAIESVMSKKFQNAFGFVRPPGHHAGPNYSKGFCIFNNISIGASYLLKKFKLNRVLIIDIDSHHGNGTQEIFYKNKKVLFISLHEDPFEFPLTGFVDEVGEKEGLGYTVNIPLPYGTGDKIYLKAFNTIAFPIIKQYQPEFILVSTGFDGHYRDPVGSLSLSSYSYLKIFDILLELSSKFCQEKIVSILEGGYDLKILGKIATATTARLAKIPYIFEDRRTVAIPKTRKKGEKIIDKVREIQSSFWRI
jgi:acetoin utilization deacetylase AcuC-like enzyme